MTLTALAHQTTDLALELESLDRAVRQAIRVSSRIQKHCDIDGCAHCIEIASIVDPLRRFSRPEPE